MTTPYVRHGRTRQKLRTRDALIAAARALVADGGAAPTVAEAAAEANVSRTTAYRYFPNQNALLVAAHPEVAAASLLPADVGGDPEVRLLAAVDAFIALVLDTEHQQRTMLRLSLEPGTTADLPLRKGRAITWFTEALAPLAPLLTDAGVLRLVLAIRSAVGVEALTWLTDVGGLSRPEAAVLMRSSARALLRQAVADEAGREHGPTT